MTKGRRSGQPLAWVELVPDLLDLCHRTPSLDPPLPTGVSRGEGYSPAHRVTGWRAKSRFRVRTRNGAPCPDDHVDHLEQAVACCPSSTAWSGQNGSISGVSRRVPPAVGHRVHAVVGLDDERRVLLRRPGVNQSCTCGESRYRPRRGRARGRRCSAPRNRHSGYAGTAPRSWCDRDGGGSGRRGSTASGATPSAASGSRISARAATIPGSTMIVASASRTSTTVLPTRARVAGL